MTNQNDSKAPTPDPKDQPPSQAPMTPTAPQEGQMSEESDGNSNDEKNVSKELAREFRWVEFAQIASNVVLAIVGIIAVCIYNGQLKEMRKSTKATQDAAIAAKTAADAATSAANTAAASLTLTKTAFEIDERAWVGIVSFYSLRNISNNSVPGFAVGYSNAGKSPAFNLKPDVQVDIVSTLPEKSPSHRTPYPTHGGTIAVLPGKEGKTGYGLLDHSLSVEEVMAVVSGTKFLCVHGTLTYTDIFTTDKPPRVTSFCAIYHPRYESVEPGFKMCLHDNEMK